MDPLLRRLRRLAGPDEPDGRLLARHAAGDPAAVDELVRRHGPLVWAAARRRLPDPADAADVFQATFLLLLQKRGRLAGTPAVGPWLYRVAALTARNLRRKNARRLARRRPLFDLPGSADPHLSADLDDALLLLPERDRAAVVLCHLQGYSRREAAGLLGVPEGTLSSVLSRALAKLRTRLGDPLPLLAAGALAVPAGLVTASPHTLSLARGVVRMFWLKKLVAGGLTAAACLGLGVGVGLAPRPAAVAAADPPAKSPATDPGPSEDELDRLRKELAELQRQEITARDRASAQAAALREAEQRLAAKRGAVIRLRVSAENHPWDAYVRLEETDAAGTVVADFGCGGGKFGTASLATHLRRARLDPAGGRTVVMEVSPKLDPFDLGIVAQAVANAGFPVVTYTGPLPESWTLGKNQNGKPARSWTGMKLVKGERVELAKALPIDPPAADGLKFYVIVLRADGGEDVTAMPCTGSETVLDAVGLVGERKAAGKVNVWVARRVAGGPEQVLPVDWLGITERGLTKTNYQLQPGDRLYIKRPKADG